MKCLVPSEYDVLRREEFNAVNPVHHLNEVRGWLWANDPSLDAISRYRLLACNLGHVANDLPDDMAILRHNLELNDEMFLRSRAVPRPHVRTTAFHGKLRVLQLPIFELLDVGPEREKLSMQCRLIRKCLQRKQRHLPS